MDGSRPESLWRRPGDPAGVGRGARKALLHSRIRWLALFALAFALPGGAGATSTAAEETRYLVFQVWPAMPGYPGILPVAGRHSLSKEQMSAFVRGVAQAIGTTGDAGHKLGFAFGPLSIDLSDEETRQ